MLVGCEDDVSTWDKKPMTFRESHSVIRKSYASWTSTPFQSPLQPQNLPLRSEIRPGSHFRPKSSKKKSQVAEKNGRTWRDSKKGRKGPTTHWPQGQRDLRRAGTTTVTWPRTSQEGRQKKKGAKQNVEQISE